MNEISRAIIGAAIEVHRELGPGLLESNYEVCLACEFSCQGIRFERQWPIPIRYKTVSVDCGHRADFLVEDEVIVELKSVTAFDPVHTAQMLSYLKHSKRRLGLLINFNVPVLVQGIRRISL